MIGESPAAKAIARGAFRPAGHETPLGPDLSFVEAVLDYLSGWPAPDAAAPEGVISFVRYDFNERRAASLGREFRLSAEGPRPGAMHLCSDPHAPVRLFETDLPDLGSHHAALAARQLGSRTMVLFDPPTRIASVVCDEIPWPGVELDLSRGKPTWGNDAVDGALLDGAISDFNIDVVEGSTLKARVTDGHGLRPGGRRRYNEILYLHLRYGLGLDRRSNCGVRITRTGLGLWPRKAREERLATFGRRVVGSAPSNPKAVVERGVARWTARGDRPTLHMRCLCCDGSNICACAAAQPGITVAHPHLAP